MLVRVSAAGVLISGTISALEVLSAVHKLAHPSPQGKINYNYHLNIIIKIQSCIIHNINFSKLLYTVYYYFR